MSWRPLKRFRDSRVAKLDNLRRGARAGLRVPETVWQRASVVDVERVAPPPEIPAPWIVRSASPTEDTRTGTAAGQFVSRAVEREDEHEFRAAVNAVLESLPRDARNRPDGAVFVQPLLAPERGGVVFFDGFNFECTTAPGGNRALTSGEERGTVERAQLERGDAFSEWLKSLARVFRDELGSGVLDVEFARDGDDFTLLQARPARFGLLRNPVLSLANHREILGDPPSPWVVSALELASADALRYFAEVDPEVARWDEAYAVVLGGRAWLNFSFFFRLMDHWGLPRTFVTEGVGGESGGPLDARLLWGRFLRKGPRLVALQLKNLLTVLRAERDLAEFERRVRASDSLRSLHAATAFGLGVALRTNFAINGALTGVVRLRRFFGIRGRARVTTEALMEDYDALRSVAPAALDSRLDAWLSTYGHRGPLESDPARPRFAELRDVLAADLRRGVEPSATAPTAPTASGRESRGLLFAMDRRREWFRDELMRVWQELRTRILAAAENEGLERVDDAFLLTDKDFAAAARPKLDERRAELDRLARIELPSTVARSEIEQHLAGQAAPTRSGDALPGSFQGVSLANSVFEGNVRRADDLVRLLEDEQRSGHTLLDRATVLVVRALEPSWAVVFGRVGAVVTELGGELSHASILLREAQKPAIVNCRGVFDALADGERVRLDGARGVVERVA